MQINPTVRCHFFISQVGKVSEKKMIILNREVRAVNHCWRIANPFNLSENPLGNSARVITMPMLFWHSNSPSKHIFERNSKTVYNKDLRENIHYNENSKIHKGGRSTNV